MENEAKWTGWVMFAGIYMIIVGFFQLIAGLAALFRSEVIFAAQGTVWLVSLETWGWTILLIGVTMLLAGFGVLSGSLFGRIIGVIAAAIAAVVNFAFIPVYPIWSIIALTIDSVVIYALIAHGSREEMGMIEDTTT